MNPKLPLETRSFPSRIADLGFSALLPAGWVAHDLPKEEVDFSDPTRFFPLAIVTAPHAAIVFAFVARPAYDDGTLHDWAWYLLNHNQIKPRAVGAHTVGHLAAIVGEATQTSDVGPMVLRFAFVEDGGRLLNLTLMAPEMLADTMNDAWFAMLNSFKLETPHGSRFAAELPPQSETPPPTPQPESEPAPAATEPSHAEAFGKMNAFGMELPDEVAVPQPTPKPAQKVTFADFALENDTTSLDPETSINANLRDRGIGLVPNVAAANDVEKRATVSAGAVMAQFDVPYGWHVIDDGKRTLVFEPSGKVQISLNLIPREGRNHAAILDALEAQVREDYPQPEFMRMMEGKIHALGIRNIADAGQPLEQYHLLYPFRDETMVLRARVTATPDQATAACNLAELILESFVFDCFSQRDEPPTATGTNAPSAGGQPEWWLQALALEAQDKLEAAEKVIHDGCPYIGFAYSTAEMYRLRMLRLKQAGEANGALEAFKKSSDFIFFYASMATSGGEGAALSVERDQFRAELVRAYGSDPVEVSL